MAYLVNRKTGCIHDASKPHAKARAGKHYERVETLAEAKAKASKSGHKPQLCKNCGFALATIEECYT